MVREGMDEEGNRGNHVFICINVYRVYRMTM